MKYLITMILLLSFIAPSQAQHSKAPYSTEQAEQVNQSQSAADYSQAQLAQMLAPIALYPDTLLTHILIAATYPLEIVQAQRWLNKYDDLSAQRLAYKIQDEMSDNDWDASVKALMPFPRVLQRLNDDLDWTQQLGDAFLTNESMVLASIQQLRKQAQLAGSLAQMSNSTVSFDGNDIIIEPQQTQLVYVPYYDARVVYGTWHWRHYPPVYWSIPNHFYSGHHYQAHHQPFYWSAAVHISHRFFFGAFHWHNRHVVVINHDNNKHYAHRRNSSYSVGAISSHPSNHRAKLLRSKGAKHWQHSRKHKVTHTTKLTHKRSLAHRPKQVKKQPNKYHSKQVGKQPSKRHPKQVSKQNSKRVHTKKHYAHREISGVKTSRMNKLTQQKSAAATKYDKVLKPNKNKQGKSKQLVTKTQQQSTKYKGQQRKSVSKNSQAPKAKQGRHRETTKKHRLASTGSKTESKNSNRKER